MWETGHAQILIRILPDCLGGFQYLSPIASARHFQFTEVCNYQWYTDLMMMALKAQLLYFKSYFINIDMPSLFHCHIQINKKISGLLFIFASCLYEVHNSSTETVRLW